MGCYLGLIRNSHASHSEKRYNGLKNQGSTCYLNAVLQCLYMTKDFRTAVLRLKHGPQNSRQGVLCLELQKIFDELKKSNATTEGIIQSLCIRNVYEQQDAVEYYQKILKSVGAEVSKVFEGKMCNKSKCLNEHIFEEKCSFITIPLAIEAGNDEVYSVSNGLESFFKPSHLDEDNWFYCDECDKKTETETWSEIEEFPKVLTLHLKRFDFDYMQMKHVKNHCAMDIPLSLHIKDHEYDLYAVVNHRGDRSGGHYNAIIKSFEDNQWYCFDDCSVNKHSVDSLKKSRLAYLLMYRELSRRKWSALVSPRVIITGVFFMCLVPFIWGAIKKASNFLKQ
ncbi:ubiquitin carboxyl-terminal hydrolase 47 [Hoplias malabaricus]|uniref:ubiquitin carboxyl-terminal hydrolase 47 n=1 Tax=Hoplias malabaricus TaxID=27720 RepID=UPI003461A4F9